MRRKKLFNLATLFVLNGFLLMALFISGCATNAGTGALAGGGIGALAGQIIGKNTTGTLIGAGIGTGLGYVVGNERDKTKAAEHKIKQTYAPLGGTKWKILSIKPANKVPKFSSKIVSFDNDGRVITTTTYPDKSRDVSTESYRVTGNTLIVNRKGYIINYKFSINGKSMTARVKNVVISMRRL